MEYCLLSASVSSFDTYRAFIDPPPSPDRAVIDPPPAQITVKKRTKDTIDGTTHTSSSKRAKAKAASENVANPDIGPIQSQASSATKLKNTAYPTYKDEPVCTGEPSPADLRALNQANPTASAIVAAENLLCSITHELPVHPVFAPDGFIYEKSAILAWFHKNSGMATSPRTRETMENKVFPALQVLNTIKDLVEGGVIVGDLATSWKKRMEAYKETEHMKRKANAGDTNAMNDLGDWHEHGKHDLPLDLEQAFKWYKKSADMIDVQGLEKAGTFLLLGQGTSRNDSQGIYMITLAAQNKSETACLLLGSIFEEGYHGLPKDVAQANFWYSKGPKDSSGLYSPVYEDYIEKKRAEEERWYRDLNLAYA